MLERFFRLSENQTTARVELVAGLTTLLTMAYIIVVFEGHPAFLTVAGIPLSYSIADGLALGVISHQIIKLCSGRGRETGRLAYVLAVILMAYFVFVRSTLR